MQMFFNRTIGKNQYTFSVEGNNLFELIEGSQKIGFHSLTKCGLCGKDNLYPRSYTTKEGGFEYVKVICADCKGQVTFGKSKDKKDVYYLRKNEDKTIAWEKYKEE